MRDWSGDAECTIGMNNAVGLGAGLCHLETGSAEVTATGSWDLDRLAPFAMAWKFGTMETDT